MTSSVWEKDFLRISSCPYSAKSPIHQSHVYGRIKILQTLFEKGHPRNIPVIYFKIWLAVSEKIFKKFLHVHVVQKAPIHQSHVYGQIKISRTVFEMGHQRNIPVKLFQNRTSSF